MGDIAEDKLMTVSAACVGLVFADGSILIA